MVNQMSMLGRIGRPDERWVSAPAHQRFMRRIDAGCVSSRSHPRLILLVAVAMLVAGMAGEVFDDGALVRWLAVVIVVSALLTIIGLLPSLVGGNRPEPERRGPAPPHGHGHL